MSAQLQSSHPDGRTDLPLSVTITQRSLWLAAALVVAILALILLVGQALGTVILLLLAIIIGEALRPVVEQLKRHHIPSPLAILMIYAVALTAAGLLIWLLLRPVADQISSLTQQLPHYPQEAQQLLVHLRERLRAQGEVEQAIQNLAPTLTAQVQRLAPTLVATALGFLGGIFNIFIQVVVVLTMTVFWLLGSASLKRLVVRLFPQGSRGTVSGVLTGVGRAFSGYVYGTLIRMTVIGTLSGIGLTILQVPFALLLGVVTAATELIPYLGPWISGSISVGVALFAVGPGKALEVVILYFLIYELEANVVQPVVLSRTVHADPLLILVSVLLGFSLLGIIGAILAVPLAAGAQVVIVQALAPAIRRAGSAAGSLTSTAAESRLRSPASS
jgi:putative heme transporter